LTPAGRGNRLGRRGANALTNVIDRLERRDFVRRQINPADRRSFVVHLTRVGESAAARVTEVLDELERAIKRAVTSRDVQGLAAVSAALETAVQQISG
jgi:DNA-binding MarR family transcriptional regulator